MTGRLEPRSNGEGAAWPAALLSRLRSHSFIAAASRFLEGVTSASFSPTKHGLPKDIRRRGGRDLSMVLATAMGTVVLTGCAVDAPPDGSEIRSDAGLVDLGLEEQWRAGGIPGEVEDNWLKTFDDLTLDALVAEALEHNPDLRIAALRVGQADQYVELAKAELLPTVNLFGTGGINMGSGDLTSALQGISLGVSWEPDLWGRMRYGRNAAQSAADAVRADYAFARQSLAASVARAWYAAAETSLQLRLAEDVVSVSRALVALAEDRWRVGIGSEQDVAMARASLGSFEDAARQVAFAHQQARRALELLVGRYPAAEVETPPDLPPLPGPVPTGLPLDMLERRPDMVAAERRVAAAFNRVGESKAAMLPRIILGANVAALDSSILELQSDFENPALGAGARLIAPIYQGGAMTAQVKLRTLEQKESVAAYARQALIALLDVEEAIAAGETLDERRRILERTVSESRRAYDLAQTRYRVGSGDLRSVQEQLISLDGARITLLRVRGEELSQRIRLHLALGGSFEEGSVAADTTGEASSTPPADGQPG